jgi:hypothetical protein
MHMTNNKIIIKILLVKKAINYRVPNFTKFCTQLQQLNAKKRTAQHASSGSQNEHSPSISETIALLSYALLFLLLALQQIKFKN